MIVSLSTSCLFYWPLRSVLRLSQETGHGGIELVLGPDPWILGPNKTLALAHDHGLEIPSIHQSLLPWTPAGSGDARMLDAARFAAEIGCPVVVIHGPWSEAWGDKASQRWLQVLDQATRAVEGTDTRLALENVGVYQDKDRANVLASNDALLAFAQSHNLGITLDTCHVGTTSPSLLDTVRHLGASVANVHLSDIRNGRFADSDWLRAIDSHHQLPGQGRLPLAQAVRDLAELGYDGPMTIEASPAALQAWSPAKLRHNLDHSRQFVEQAMACLT